MTDSAAAAGSGADPGAGPDAVTRADSEASVRPDAPSPAPDPVRDRWRTPMRRALEEAERARDSGDVPVGALVLGPGGEVIGSGHNAREAWGDPTAHAEIVAIRAAAASLHGEWRLEGCTLLVTLEPCTMCAGAIVLSRLDRVVYGAVDPKAGAAGSLWDVVRDRRLNHRPEVIHGVLADECGALLREFFRGSGELRDSGEPG